MTAKDLKNALLQEAVQGKLVPQIASEGNARDLLEEIRKEKGESLPLASALKRSSATPSAGSNAARNARFAPITEDEIPFEIPENWCWCRLGDIAEVSSSKRIYANEQTTTGVPFLRVSDLVAKINGIEKNDLYISEEHYMSFKKNGLVPKPNDVLITSRGTLGLCYIIKENDKFYFQDGMITWLSLPTNILPKYLCILFDSNFMQTLINEKSNGTAVSYISIADIKKITFPLPPLAEQKRIVDAIEKFMPLIEEYGKKQAALEAVNASIGALTKKAILQQAVQGKLVPQIAAEGNARDLLEEIRKERLSHGFANSYGICGEKDKKSKSSDLRSKSQIRVTKKELPEITEDEIPFDIPENWCWCRLGDVSEIARGGSPRPIKDYLTTDENGYNWIKIGDSDKNGKYINQTAEKIVKEGLNKTRLVHKGDFLLTNSMSFGRPYILNIDGCIHDGWLVISPKGNIFNKDFLYYVLSSSFAYNQFCESVSGAVVKNLNSDKVRESLIPLPPLAEQKRIVAAIEKMLPLCEKLGV